MYTKKLSSTISCLVLGVAMPSMALADSPLNQIISSEDHQEAATASADTTADTTAGESSTVDNQDDGVSQNETQEVSDPQATEAEPALTEQPAEAVSSAESLEPIDEQAATLDTDTQENNQETEASSTEIETDVDTASITNDFNNDAEVQQESANSETVEQPEASNEESSTQAAPETISYESVEPAASSEDNVVSQAANVEVQQEAPATLSNNEANAGIASNDVNEPILDDNIEEHIQAEETVATQDAEPELNQAAEPEAPSFNSGAFSKGVSGFKAMSFGGTRNLQAEPALGLSASEVTAGASSARSMSASVALINHAQDMVASDLLSQMSTSSAVNGLFTSSIGTSKIKTGSHVQAIGGNVAVGFSKGFQYVSLGAYVEGGLSYFRSYDDVKVGEGHSRFAGLGAMLMYNYKLAYVNANVHGGMLQINADFKSHTHYLGGAVELGVHLNSYIDAYTRYSFGRTGSIDADFEQLAQKCRLDATNSHRVRLGVKTQLPQYTWQPYLGLAIEREFNGKTRCTVVDTVAAPTLKGNTGIVELGVKHDFNKHVSGKINVEGTLGRRRGVSGGLTLAYKF